MDDIFGDEIDDLDNFDEDNLEPQNLQVEVNQEDVDDGNKDDDNEEEKETKVKPKRVIKNPRVTLNVERLKGPKGVGVLESCFEKVKFKGKDHEEEDLNVLLKTYEYWCHRLFPKFSFNDSIAKIENLGKKAAIQTHLKKVRSGMIEDDHPSISGIASDLGSDDEARSEEMLTSQSATQTVIQNIPIELTEEQLETIRRNRAKAEQVRKERLKNIQEKALINLPKQNIEPLMEGSSMTVLGNDRDYPTNNTNRLQGTNIDSEEYENNSNDNHAESNSIHSRSELDSNSEIFLETRDNNIDKVNSRPNGECEFNQQSIKNNAGDEHESIVGEMPKDETENYNTFVGKTNEADSEAEELNIDSDE